MKQIEEDLEPILKSEQTRAASFLNVMKKVDDNMAKINEYNARLNEARFKTPVLSDQGASQQSWWEAYQQSLRDHGVANLSSRISAMGLIGKRQPRD